MLLVSLALRDLLAPLAPQVRALKACLDPKDLLDPKDPPDVPLLANLEPQVDLANPVPTDCLVRRETLEPLEPRDQGEPPEPPEAPDLLVSLLLANPDLQVSLEQWDQGESPV